MAALSPKPVIMITAFGTTSAEGQKDLENVDRMVCERYPDYEVRWAITSPFIVRRLKENGQTALFARQVPIRNREQLLDELREEGKTNIVIQPLLVMTGAEYFAMRHRYKESPNIWRPFQQEFNQLLLGFATEPRRSTRSWLRLNPPRTLPLKGGLPPPNTTPVNTDHSSDLNRRTSFSQEINRAHPPTF